MRLCRYGRSGFEKPGMIDADGRVRDLSKIVEQIGPLMRSEEHTSELQSQR